MPHTRSAKKRLRQSAKRRLHNRAVIKDLKGQIKKVMGLAGETKVNAEELNKEWRQAVMKLDKAASRRIVHPNQAARKKSQLAQEHCSEKSPPASHS